MSTEPMSMEQAIDALVQTEEQPVEEVVEEEIESESEPTDELDDEQPEEDSEDEGEEVEEESDDESEDDPEEDDSEDEDSEDEVEDDESEDPAQETHTVKVDGEEKQVTLDELKRGYSGQQYVQKGMQQAAEARKQAEDVFAALTQERNNLAQIVQQVQQGAITPPTPPTREMFDNDPIGYMEADLNYKEQMQVYQQNMQIVQQQLSAQTEAEGKAREAYLAQEAQQLVERNPNLADPKNMDAFLESVGEAGKLYGYTQEQIGAITSTRDMEVLADAGKWRKLQEGKSIVREKSKKARKPIKPKAKRTNRKNDEVRAKRDKLRRSGSVEDAMALILDPNLR